MEEGRVSLNAAMIQAMVDKGLSGQDIADIAKAGEAKVDRTGAERQARHRDKKRGRVTRDSNGVTPPIEEIIPPLPVISPDGEKRKAPRAPAADPFPCPPDCDELDWQGLLESRKAARKPMTASAYRSICKKLAGWAEDGWPPGPILANAAEKGWQTVFPTDEMKNQANGQLPSRQSNFQPSAGNRGSRPNPLVDILAACRAEDSSGDFGDGDAAWPPLRTIGSS